MIKIEEVSFMKKTHFVAYPAVLSDRENEKGIYTVTFPDVPGVVSQGNGIADSLVKGAEALGLMLYDQKDLPKASQLEVVRKQYPDDVVTYIVDDLVTAAKQVTDPLVRKNTTIPASLAKRAEEKHINFSQALADKLKEMVSDK